MRGRSMGVPKKIAHTGFLIRIIPLLPSSNPPILSYTSQISGEFRMAHRGFGEEGNPENLILESLVSGIRYLHLLDVTGAHPFLCLAEA